MNSAIATRPASRFDNPFATCWTRPGALPWRPSDGIEAEAVLAKLDRARSGQIVGAHGSGKSTLLEALSDRLRQRGERVSRMTINGAHVTPRQGLVETGDTLLVDGYEQLKEISAGRLRWRCRRRRVKLVVTTHQPMSIKKFPLLATLTPSLEQVCDLFQQLTAGHPTPVQAADVEWSFHRRRGNVRDIWFDLYDRHERLSRQL